ncbi:hypothetical protein SAMN06269250_4134 [Spirosoma fluviale]|uniref:Uncharacterized protein n=1 Tax=Spirosoma fluviale TaxID=1597977 RepID=A0A286GB76_9BACT|nr:hypothetical protein SAMN06269250_4134 [Spirosoma fluviale]
MLNIHQIAKQKNVTGNFAEPTVIKLTDKIIYK